MARLAPASATENAEFHLDYLFERWSNLPELDEFEAWDLLDQLDFIFEWAIPADFFDRLSAIQAAGNLTEAQECRYQELLRLMAEKQPLLDEILKD
jgi:hypothetical protein